MEAENPLELAVTINHFAEPFEATWQKDNIALDTRVKGITSWCGIEQCKLKIDCCLPADAGEYSVTVMNPSGFDISSANITINGFLQNIRIIISQCHVRFSYS